jgi:uncharacterized membrane protein (DUF4010 family)
VNAERFASMAVALAVGFLIGLQREQSSSQEAAGERSALGGIRTYPLVALAGAICVLLAGKFGLWLVALGFVSFLIPFTLAYADDLRKGRDRGITTEVAFVLTYFLGCLATADGIAGSTKERLLLCASLGVAVTALLSFKDPLHALAARISRDDLYATMKFAILALVILPLLPDKAYGPYQALNPFHIGLFIVLTAGVSFVGYIAVRLLGPGRGLGVTGLVGGLVSSTAITLSLSGRAKLNASAREACALGIVLASTVMAFRVIGLVAVINRPLVPAVAVPMGGMALAGLAAAGLLYIRSRKEVKEGAEVRFSNPFEIASAMKFGLVFTIVMVASKFATETWGNKGTYITALLAGSTDVDAITLSLSRLSMNDLGLRAVAIGIFLACVSNNLVKAGMACVVGGWAFGWRLGLTFLVMIAAGVAALFLLPVG